MSRRAVPSMAMRCACHSMCPRQHTCIPGCGRHVSGNEEGVAASTRCVAGGSSPAAVAGKRTRRAAVRCQAHLPLGHTRSRSADLDMGLCFPEVEPPSKRAPPMLTLFDGPACRGQQLDVELAGATYCTVCADMCGRRFPRGAEANVAARSFRVSAMPTGATAQYFAQCRDSHSN